MIILRNVLPTIMCICTFILLCACMLAVPAFAQKIDDLPDDERIRELIYDKNDIYTITTRTGYQSNIEFSSAEQIETISVGDRSLWQIIPAGHRLFIRPLDIGMQTNMTVITSRRAYQFDLKSATEKEEDTVIYVMRFVYPGKPKRMLAAPVQPYTQAPFAYASPETFPGASPKPAVTPYYGPSTSPVFTPTGEPDPIARPVVLTHSATEVTPLPSLEGPPPKEARNYNYTYSGPDADAPLEIFDDGRAIYFRFENADVELPSIVTLHSSGKEIPVTPYQVGAYVVVDVISPQLLIRTQNSKIFVFNENLLGQ